MIKISSQITVLTRILKSRRVSFGRHVACIGEMRNVCLIVSRKAGGIDFRNKAQMGE
jgi:hypothetical protein